MKELTIEGFSASVSKLLLLNNWTKLLIPDTTTLSYYDILVLIRLIIIRSEYFKYKIASLIIN